MQLIAPGLWRWTAPHPAWRPGAAPDSTGDWDRDVACALHLTPDAAVFFDPLLPPDAAGFWAEVDPLVAGRPVAVLTTIRWHRRSRDELVARYRASISKARSALATGVRAIQLRGAGETVFWLEGPRSLIVGDRILGGRTAGELRLNPESWMRYLSRPIGHAELRATLRPLLDLPIERVLVSHGPPVLTGGAAAIRRLLAA